ncbi:hypothetical protein AK812_SmicGene39165 [Symbiodinium microadriaticum]|uniref:Uncharacterized protein n=1 Tax=Symbiodinium microadriaticum TaxID=2951 RepID=A0A1Q9CBX9_SYMMI|nr:hypothetical protein AK812_SmicGene39165 [Symbiodinium microadriaticum]
MSGRDPSFVENELFMRSQTHAKSTHPRQPWEQPGMLCVFNPVQAVFPSQLSVPYQGPQASSTNAAPGPQRRVHDSAAQPVAYCQAWTRAVKAKRGPASADKRNEAFNKILSLLHAFSSFFDLASLLEDDENEGDSLRAVLAPKAPSTILKHAGPVRTFCEWLVKSNSSPPFGEKVVWTFVHCVLKMPRTAASTLDTCLRAIKWSYHSLGLRVQLEVFRSARVSGLVTQALQDKSPWDPAPPLTVAEVLQLHSIAHDNKMILPLVIPGIGIGQAPFGQLLLDIRNEEEDEALAVVSDDSDSDAEDADMLTCTAMTSPVDSAPYFIQRAEEISLGRRVSDALKAKGVNTLAQLAFCVGQPGQVLASTEFDSWSEGILTDLTVGEKASLRRLILEAQTMLVASLKDMTESSEGATPKKVGVAERSARMDQLRAQLAGVSLTGPLEPSHALLDLAVQQWETRCLRYIGPEKCHSREDEVQNIKPVSTSLSVEGGKIKVTEDAGVEDRDIEGSLQVLNALRRRGVAYAFARLISWDKHVSLRQILRADKLAFSKMSEAGEDIRADASGVCPLDDMISSILQDYDLIVSLLPLGDLDGPSGKARRGRGGRPGPYTDNSTWKGDSTTWKGRNGKGKGSWGGKGYDTWTGKGKNPMKGKDKSGKGKGSGAAKPEWLPEGLRYQGASAWNHKGNKLASALVKQGYFSYGVDRVKHKSAMAPVLQMDLSSRSNGVVGAAHTLVGLWLCRTYPDLPEIVVLRREVPEPATRAAAVGASNAGYPAAFANALAEAFVAGITARRLPCLNPARINKAARVAAMKQPRGVMSEVVPEWKLVVYVLLPRSFGADPFAGAKRLKQAWPVPEDVRVLPGLKTLPADSQLLSRTQSGGNLSPQLQQEMQQLNGSWVLRVGIPWDPIEFIGQAGKLGHPFHQLSKSNKFLEELIEQLVYRYLLLVSRLDAYRAMSEVVPEWKLVVYVLLPRTFGTDPFAGAKRLKQAWPVPEDVRVLPGLKTLPADSQLLSRTQSGGNLSPQLQREMQQLNGSWVLRVGIPWDPIEFIGQAGKLGHPFHQLSKSNQFLEELIEQLVYRPSVVRSKRKSYITRWSNRAKTLEPEEAKLKAGMAPHRRKILDSKRILLFKEMLEEIKYDDIEVVQEIIEGATLTGDIQVTGVLDAKFKPARIDVSELMEISEQVKQQIRDRTVSCGNSETDALLWSKTLEEVDKGHLEGPLEFESVPEDCLISSRFPIMQGDKLRPIDNYSSSLINDTVTVSEKPVTHSIDEIALLITKLSRVARKKGLKEVFGRTADLKSAYRQLAIADESLRFSYLAVYDPTEDKAKVFRQLAVPFGSTKAVYFFLRVARALWTILVKGALVPTTNYFDDFVLLALSGDRTFMILTDAAFEKADALSPHEEQTIIYELEMFGVLVGLKLLVEKTTRFAEEYSQDFEDRICRVRY